MGIKVIYSNRKAYHEYTISDKYEAGISLYGTEVKALREGKCNLSEGWIDITAKQEAVLMNAQIGLYSFGNQNNHLETRPRPLLLHKKEILKLTHQIYAKGFNLVPLKIYFKGQRVKIEIGLAKGKKLHDKRQSSKTKDANRDMERALRNN